MVFWSAAIVQTTQEMTRTLQNQREDSISDLPHPLPMGQVCFKQFPTPGPEGLDLSWGLPGGGGGMVTAQIE